MSEDQNTIRFEGKVESADHLGLSRAIQIDHQVTAGDEIEIREGRIANDVLNGEVYG